MIPIRNYPAEISVVRNRITILFTIILLLVLILVARLGYLQIHQYQRFSTLAQNNRIDISPLPPIRGLIFDRNGEILAENLKAYNLEILPDKVEDMDSLLHELGQLIELTDAHLKPFRLLLKERPSFVRQTLKANLSEQEVAIIAVNQHRYDGVGLKARLQRYYPKEDLTSHVIGYVGRISKSDLEKVDNQAYRGMEYIGKSGIEARYESMLLGKLGVVQVETNAHGRIIRKLEETTSNTGKTLYLSMDIKLQEKSVEAMQGYEGAVVAIEPGTGDILAFVSAPGYDPNPFVNGISETEYDSLKTSDRKPLLNRALSGRYAPGSTIKGFISLVGMENGINHSMTSYCPGWYSLPNHTHRYRCWKKYGHGWLDGYDSIVQSCDVYFYRLAEMLGIDKINEGMTRFGFGEQTGIDLLGEPSGLIPSREWKRQRFKQPWYPGETIITGIGQGYMLVTPLQLAAATATLANYGKKIAPRFLSVIEHPSSQVKQRVAPVELGTVKLQDDDFFARVIDSMQDVVHGEKGTARAIGMDIRYRMAGKTGTAQVKSIAQDETYDEENVEKKFRDHSLFIGFAPVDDPKIAIAVVVEHAGSGSKTAAPIARKLIDYYLLERLKLYPEPPADQLTGLNGLAGLRS